jgi:hypothetical protein
MVSCFFFFFNFYSAFHDEKRCPRMARTAIAAASDLFSEMGTQELPRVVNNQPGTPAYFAIIMS